tara:strand:+ start:2297 stop:2473 length:177 start_codon:yes stop_codon:yes gene_type:complete
LIKEVRYCHFAENLKVNCYVIDCKEINGLVWVILDLDVGNYKLGIYIFGVCVKNMKAF